MWINNEKDFQDALDLINETGKVVFWCIGPGTGKKRDRPADDSDDDCSSKKKTASEMKASRVNESFVRSMALYIPVFNNYAMWAEMLVGGGHDRRTSYVWNVQS